MLQEAVVIAYALFTLEALYSLHLFRTRRTREAEQRLYTSLAALAIALPLMLVDIADLAGRLFHTQYTLFSPDLTLTYALRAKEASNATAAAMARMSTYLAVCESVAAAAFSAAAIFAGVIALFVGYAATASIAALRGLANAALMISQALYAVATLYEVVGRLALPLRALVPLGLALSVARRTRPLGGLLLALGLGLGYILPFALNSVAYEVKGVSLEAPPTGVPSVVCIRAVTAARTVDGATLAAGFPAVIEYVDLTRPGRVVVRPSGCYVELTGEYRVTRVFFGPEPVRVEVGFTVRPLPPGLNLTYLAYDDLVVGRVPFPDLARAAELAGNNVTVFVPWGPMPLRLDAERFTALWDDGYFSWVATNIFNFTELGARRASGETAKWYNFTYFPTRYGRLEAVLWGAGDSWSFSKNVTVVRDGRNYTVTVNCTAWEGYAYGALKEVEVVDRGLVEVNGSLIEPEVVVEWRPRYRWEPDAWRRFANETFNRWFNQSARIFNHTFVARGPLYVELGLEGGSVRELAVSVRTSYYRGPVKAFLNPYFHWGTPPEIPIAFVRAVYCGRLVRPARAALTLSDAYYAGQPVRAEYLLLLGYDPLLEPFARDVPLTITFREEARNFIFHIYPFIWMVGVAFALGVFAMDAVSGFMGGPSLSFRFLPRRFQQAYWDVFVRELPRLIYALAGKHLPVPHSALIPARYRPVLEQLRREAELVRKQYPLQRLRAWAAQTRVGQALQRARQLVQARAARLRGAVDEALRSAAQRLEARGHRVAPRLVELTRRVLTEAGPRAAYWAFMLARYTWEHRSEHTVNALLRGAAHALRAHAIKKYGRDAHLHPVGFRLLRLADRLELVELLLNNRALAERLVWRLSLSLYERAREVRAAEAAEGYAVTVALQARELATVLLRQQREAGLALLDAAERLEAAARGLQAKREAFKAARDEHRLAAETLRFWERVLAEARRTGERVEERERMVEEWARAEREARRALEAARAELERARAELLELAREVEGLIRREAPEVYGYVERALREAFELASRVEEMGVDAYGRAVERVVHALSLLAGSDAPSWAREAARQAMERWEQLLKDWRQVYRTEKQFEVLQQLAARGEALQPPKPEVPQPSAAPAGLEELAARSEVERLASELRGALAGHDYGRLPGLIDRYVEALERLEREAAGTPLADWARQERESWLAARDELLAPPEALYLRGEAERLAGELRKALDAKDYLAVAERLPEYAEVLARLSEAPAPQLAGWAREELERLGRVRDELLRGYYEVAEALGGEPLAALKADRFAFELVLSLAHVSADAAAQLVERIPDERLREWARGYIKAAEAYARAGEEVEPGWARARVYEAFSALGSNEARAGFIAYAIERSLPLIKFHDFGASARIVEKAFYEEARRLAVSPEPEDWRSLLDKFAKTYDPEILGKALAHAALAGEVDEFRRDGRVQGFVEKCRGDVSRFKWWVEQRPRVEGEVAARLQAIYQELSEIEERAMALRSEWVPEPGESAALRMRAELEVAKAREVVAELLERVEELRAEGEALRKRAEFFLLPTHQFDKLRDRVNRLIDLLTRLGDELW